jgi:CheY-like chemotaxis protein
MPSSIVVTFSPQPSVAYFLKGVLDCAGFTVVSAASELDELEAQVERMRPDAVVYDVSFPFAENWHSLQQLRSRGAMRGIPVVITTSEARELFRRVGVSDAIELFRRPDDVVALRRAVCATIERTRSAHATYVDARALDSSV